MAEIDDDWETAGDDAMVDEDAASSGAPAVPLMKFCPYDSSMLYPREDSASKKLKYACKLCAHTEATSHNLIYRNRLRQGASDVLSNVNPNMIDDPTMSRSNKIECKECGGKDAVFFQSVMGGHDSLPLILICVQCGNKWVG